jgi:hypothetical protein
LIYNKYPTNVFFRFHHGIFSLIGRKEKCRADGNKTADSVTTRFCKLDLKKGAVIVHAARKGVRTKVFYDFANTIIMPEKHLAGLIHLNSRTMILLIPDDLKIQGVDARTSRRAGRTGMIIRNVSRWVMTGLIRTPLSCSIAFGGVTRILYLGDQHNASGLPKNKTDQSDGPDSG